MRVLLTCILLAGCATQPQVQRDSPLAVAMASCAKDGVPRDSSRWDECIEKNGGGEPDLRYKPSDRPIASQGPSVDWGRIADSLLKGAAVMGAMQAAQPAPPPPMIVCRNIGGGVTICQ